MTRSRFFRLLSTLKTTKVRKMLEFQKRYLNRQPKSIRSAERAGLCLKQAM